MVLFAWAAVGIAVLLLLGAAALLLLDDALAALVIGMLAAVALAVVLRTALRLRRWPAGRLGFFRDRLVLVQGRTELQAQWSGCGPRGASASGRPRSGSSRPPAATWCCGSGTSGR